MDGFPISRDHWMSMTDQELLPDSVLVLSDEDAPANFLLNRFTQQKGLPDPSTFKSKKEPVAEDEVGLLLTQCSSLKAVSVCDQRSRNTTCQHAHFLLSDNCRC